MISPLPWHLDENGDKIYDNDGNLIAENYTFLHVDDFEFICDATTFLPKCNKEVVP